MTDEAQTDELAALRARLADVERQLRRQELFTRSVLRASLEGFHIVGTDGMIRDCNEAFADLVGYTRDELLTMPIYAIDRRPREEIGAVIGQLIDLGGLRFVTQHHHRDGHAIDVEVSAHLVEQDGDRFFACFSHGISEQLAREQALKASEGRLRAVFERTSMLIALLDTRGRLLERNHRLTRLAGPLAAGDVGADLWDLSMWARDSDRRTIEACVKAAATGASQGCEVELRGAGGDIATVALQIGPLLDESGRCVQLLAEGYDVTAQRRAEAERAEIQRRLLDAQEEVIRELSTPLIPLEAGVLVAPLIGRLDRTRAAVMLERLLSAIVERRATTAILDITGVPVVDEEVAASLVQAAQAVQLLGARAVLTGVRPEVASTLVDLGLDLRGLVTLDSLQTGLAWARARARRPAAG